jgi:hypothetical protein
MQFATGQLERVCDRRLVHPSRSFHSSLLLDISNQDQSFYGSHTSDTSWNGYISLEIPLSRHHHPASVIYENYFAVGDVTERKRSLRPKQATGMADRTIQLNLANLPHSFDLRLLMLLFSNLLIAGCFLVAAVRGKYSLPLSL